MVLILGEVIERLVRTAMAIVVDIGYDFDSGFGEGVEGVDLRVHSSLNERLKYS